MAFHFPPLRSFRKIVNENPHVFPFHPDETATVMVVDALDGGGKSRGIEREFNGVETG